MVLEQVDIHMQTLDRDTDLIPFRKINSMWKHILDGSIGLRMEEGSLH